MLTKVDRSVWMLETAGISPQRYPDFMWTRRWNGNILQSKDTEFWCGRTQLIVAIGVRDDSHPPKHDMSIKKSNQSCEDRIGLNPSWKVNSARLTHKLFCLPSEAARSPLNFRCSQSSAMRSEKSFLTQLKHLKAVLMGVAVNTECQKSICYIYSLIHTSRFFSSHLSLFPRRIRSTPRLSRMWLNWLSELLRFRH
jgi:hypothetical protein